MADDPEVTREMGPGENFDGVTLYHGDCVEVMASLPAASVDAIVTDPPYGLEFMGKEWDSFGDTRQPGDENFTPGSGPFGRAKVRYGMSSSYATPGMSAPGIGEREIAWPSHLGGLNPRCQACDRWQRGANPCTCEEPEFPNDRAARTAAFGEWCTTWAVEAFRLLKPGGHLLAFGGSRTWHRLAVAVEDAGFELRDSIAWLYGSGFPKSLNVAKAIDKTTGHVGDAIGTETVDVGMQGGHMHTGHDRKMAERVVRAASEQAAAWQGWGTALKPAFEPIVVARKPLRGSVARNVLDHGTGALNIDACRVPADADYEAKCASVVGLANNRNGDVYGEWSGVREDSAHPAGRWPTNVVLSADQAAELADAGRYFPTFRYEAKAPSDERPRVGVVAHPTVKPLDLMRWLVRLVTPPSGTVLDPFAGSGTTAEACFIEGFRCVTIERNANYLPLIRARFDKPIQQALLG